jgi:hypothetical protein
MCQARHHADSAQQGLSRHHAESAQQDPRRAPCVLLANMPLFLG